MIQSFKTKNLEVWWKGTQEEPPKDKNMKLPSKAAKKLKAILKSLNTVRSFGELKETFSANSYKFQKYKKHGEDWWEIRVSGNYRLIFHFNKMTADVTGIEYTDGTHSRP
ncbi:type II toxin-antitoxin system RelE/ParE family toxin [Leptolyngbya cf. ectocarpi LEGE 11479]|uniref:Type II toxin-antitoxin system RelE/ParE family toxin n=1 Tax=Leptolyngbya cf. ectocarpi LEGE 11479 TaxID=1828722 RepID=A0A928X0V4_LEPEC|nr:type II toxin-antitoxin system RelE/ParE family toxin [Leptolyngbya ectocarpi]MBE9066377.1 type II toxin-antitoxin system RelE/ParE family toxin [Leptolyngbya cf. ectocarpi LEGE 11479]